MIGKETMRMTPRTITVALLAAIALSLAAAAPVMASEQVESFVTTMTDPQGGGPYTQAGGHPDLETNFSLENPGNPEAAKNIAFNAPQGLFGNINAITKCTAADFAFDQCPANSQLGLITVSDNSGLLGTAPLYGIVPQTDQTALIEFIVPTLNIPIAIPITVRTASDYGLRFTVSDITQLTPLASRQHEDLGLPSRSHSQQRPVRQGLTGQSRRLPRADRHELHHLADESEHSQQSADRQSELLHRQ